MDQFATKADPYQPQFRKAEERSLCTDCGLSRMKNPKSCGQACQFIKPDYASYEFGLHGRTRSEGEPDEMYFGVYRKMFRAKLRMPRDNAQWTGITTRIAERLLETQTVDAILTLAPHPEDRWRPNPVMITKAEDMASCRGMRMGYAPLLALLEPAQEAGYKRIALIGIPCQVYALRSLEKELGFEKILVIGTPCSDNTTTENFWTFLEALTDEPETVTYLEFRADYNVEMRFEDGRKREIPFLKLPLSKLPSDFFPLTCKTCVDYTNALSDVTVGYMAGEGDQWLIVRNEQGEALVDLLGDELVVKPLGSKGKRQSAVAGFLKNVERAAGGLPLRVMPDWVRSIVAWLQPRIGPRGLEFARARLEMKAIETVLHLRAFAPKRMKNMIPAHVWALVKPYGLDPNEGETD